MYSRLFDESPRRAGRIGRQLVAFLWLGAGLCFAVPAHAGPVHTTYAVLFSGGVDAGNNHLRYYEETLRMWHIAAGLFGVDKVWVLFADGTDAGKDRTVGEAFDADPANQVSSDWSAITGAGGNILEGTNAKLSAVLSELGTVITPDDSFYFWAFDHGNGDEAPPAPASMPYNAVLNGWGANDVIRDDELAQWVLPINAKAEAYAFGQCFSGGMADDLLSGANAANRFVAWAQGNFDCSFGRGWIDAWADAIESPAIGWGTHELGEYAKQHDPFGFGPGGTGDERPGYAGYNFHFITNEAVVPVPSTLSLVGLALIVMLTTLQRRRSAVPSAGTR